MIKRWIGAALAAAAVFLWGGSALAQYVVKDGVGATQTFCSSIVGGVEYPCHLTYGLLSGSPVAWTMDINGYGGVNVENAAALAAQGPNWQVSGVSAVSSAISSATASSSFTPQAGRTFHIQLSGTAVATCYLERKLDGSNWTEITATANGSTIALYNWNYNSSGPLSEDVLESQYNVPYRLDCGSAFGAYTSGTLNVRFSQ